MGTSHRPRVDADGEDVVAADVELDAWQRTRRRPGDIAPRAQIEVALVARAAQQAALELGNDRARKMRARLAVGVELPVLIVNEEARVVFVARILERRRRAARQRRQRRDLA